LCCKRTFLSKEVLKTRGFEADVIRSTLIRSWTSEVEVIRGSEGLEAEDWKASKDCSNAIIITPISSEEYKPGATANSEDLEGIGCLFFGKRWKRTIVQLYNHYLHYSVLCLQ